MSEPPDALMLFWSLVADQEMPTGYEQDFLQLEPVMIRTSDASVRIASKVDSMTSAVWLHQQHEAEAKVEKREKRADDQFLLAAADACAFQVSVAAKVFRRTERQTRCRRASQKKVARDS